jgi:nitrate reductase NapE component
MENKDIIIGILLIASVGLAGGLGFVLIWFTR